MHTPLTTFRRRGRATVFAAVGLGVAAVTVLAGCDSGTGTGTGSSGGGLPVGASAADYQAALADMEPVQLIVQSTSPSEDSPDAASFTKFLDRVTEYSGGKITFDVTYANGITGNVLDNDDALVDGRVDIANFWPQYDPSEYPANNLMLDATVVRDPQMVTGYYSIEAAMQEVAWGTPEVVSEFTDKGVTPLVIMSPDGPTIISCREPISSLADFAGKQVRSGGTAPSTELEGMGATPVSLPYPEVYEALQRGILDCSMSSYTLAAGSGHIEVAPYILHTDTTSLASTPTNFYAGPRISGGPAILKQLVLEAAQTYIAETINYQFQAGPVDAAAQAVENGGDWLALDADVEAKLKEINDGILADLAASTVVDGEALVSRAEAAYPAWSQKVKDLGYTDEGPISTFPDWFDMSTVFDTEPWVSAVVTDILSEHAPA